MWSHWFCDHGIVHCAVEYANKKVGVTEVVRISWLELRRRHFLQCRWALDQNNSFDKSHLRRGIFYPRQTQSYYALLMLYGRGVTWLDVTCLSLGKFTKELENG